MLSHKAAQPPLPISRNLSYDIKTYPPAAINNIYYEFLKCSLLCLCFSCTYICTSCMCGVYGGSEDASDPPGTNVTGCCEPLCGCWGHLFRRSNAPNCRAVFAAPIKKFKSDYCFLEGYSRNIRSGYPHPSPSSFQQVPFIY